MEKETVLVVDESPASRSSTVELLRAGGHDVVELPVRSWDDEAGEGGALVEREVRTTVGRLLFNQILPDQLRSTLRAAEQRTAANNGLHVNLAVGYGGRREIADAMRSIVRDHGKGGGSIDDLAEILTPELIGDHLYTQGQPDPDLIIRTSGEQRLSDFMLWQSAHSEFYFVEALGPDLREVDFLRALRDFASRERRWGR